MKVIAISFLLLIMSAHARSMQARQQSSDARGSKKVESTTSGEEVSEGDVVKVRTSLVRVPITAMDSNGRYIYDLRREEFHVFEDGVEQQVAFFNDAEQPLSIVLLIDTSVSVSSSWRAIGQSVEAFLAELRPGDKVLPVAVDSTIRVPLTHATGDHSLLVSTIREMLSKPSKGSGATHLFDAVDFINKQILPSAKGTREAVIIFSDGVDSGSLEATSKSTLRDSEEAGALYYTLHFAGGVGLPGVNDVDGWKTRAWADRQEGRAYLESLADRTGGRLIDVESGYPEITKKSFKTVAEELRHLYSLSYYPKERETKKKRRQIKVRISRPGIKVLTRRSYAYPPDKE